MAIEDGYIPDGMPALDTTEFDHDPEAQAQRRAAEKALIRDIDTRNIDDDGVWFLVAEVWLYKWRRFIGVCATFTCAGGGRPREGMGLLPVTRRCMTSPLCCSRVGQRCLENPPPDPSSTMCCCRTTASHPSVDCEKLSSTEV